MRLIAHGILFRESIGSDKVAASKAKRFQFQPLCGVMLNQVIAWSGALKTLGA
jgi:hypothetical protein